MILPTFVSNLILSELKSRKLVNLFLCRNMQMYLAPEAQIYKTSLRLPFDQNATYIGVCDSDACPSVISIGTEKLVKV